MLVTIYSKMFLEVEDDSWSARPSNALLQRLHREDSARWVACMSDSYISIGDPADGQGLVLYLPQWFMESVGEDGDEIEVEFQRSEEMPRATSLTFRLMGPGSDVEIRDFLEEPLSQLGVLQAGQIIPVPVFGGELILESCEPDGVVFLDGAEIALDILVESPLVTPVSPVAPAEADFDEPIIAAITTTFVPFQGSGNKLGSA